MALKGENQFGWPVDLEASEITIGGVELDDGETDTRAMVREDGDPLPALGSDRGALVIAGYNRGAGETRHVNVDATGRLVIAPSFPSVGTVHTDNALVAVGPVVGQTADLAAPPADALNQIVQNTTPNTVIAVRASPGVAGVGLRLPYLGTFVFDKAVDALRVELIGPGGAQAFVQQTFERP